MNEANYLASPLPYSALIVEMRQDISPVVVYKRDTTGNHKKKYTSNIVPITIKLTVHNWYN